MALWFATACGDEDVPAPVAPPTVEGAGGAFPDDPPWEGCLPGHLDVEGTCVPAGAPEPACPYGDLLLGDDTCQPPGVPADGCGQRFVHDGAGCDAVLPSEACAPGRMALPGETRCRQVAPCGSGKWGDIPRDETTQHVDASHEGASDGSEAQPWTTITDALAAADPGVVVAIAAGDYAEDILLDQEVQLWGVCPDQVTVSGAEPDPALARTVTVNADSGIYNLSITGAGEGVHAEAPTRLERCYVHDTGSNGVRAAAVDAIVVTGSLIEKSTSAGLYATDSRVEIEHSVVRDLQPYEGHDGRGVWLYNSSDVPLSDLTLRHVLIERARQHAVSLFGANALIEDTLLKDTLPKVLNNASGLGVATIRLPDAPATELEMRRSVIDGAYTAGVLILSNDAALDAVTIRNVLPDQQGIEVTGGVVIGPNELVDAEFSLVLTGSHVEAVHGACVYVEGTTAVIEAVSLAGCHATVTHEHFGFGFVASVSRLTGERAAVDVSGLRVKEYDVAGVLVLGADATLKSVAVTDANTWTTNAASSGGIVALTEIDTKESPVLTVRDARIANVYVTGLKQGGGTGHFESINISDVSGNGEAGSGVVIVDNPVSPEVPEATLRFVTVERTAPAGIGIRGAAVTIEGCAVLDSAPNPADGLFGRGIDVLAGNAQGSMAIIGSLVDRSHNSGIASFGVPTTIEGTLVRDTLPDGEDFSGHGISIRYFQELGLPGQAKITRTQVERSMTSGIRIAGADVELDQVRVLDTSARAGDFGDGILAEIWIMNTATQVFQPTTLSVRDSIVRGSDRAGISSFSAQVTIDGTTLDCNTIQLDGESTPAGGEAAFSNLGGNQCGCAPTLETCQVLSSQLSPPPAIDPLPQQP